MEMKYSTDNIIKLIILRVSECKRWCINDFCTGVCVCMEGRGGLWKHCHTVMEDFPAVFPCLSSALVSFLCETI